MIAQALTFAQYMQVGHKALQSHNFTQAHDDFMSAVSQAVGPSQLAEAWQMQGVCERLLGRLNPAQKTLGLALENARKQRGQRLLCAILRDLGEVYHDQALRANSQALRIGLFKKADSCFDESIILADMSNLVLEGTSTLSFKGVSWFDQGQKRKGRRLLREASQLLRTGNNRVYEINSLIRLMRCSFVDRWKNLPRALRLTSKDSESRADRNKVYAALLGNKSFLIIKARRQRK